MNRFAGLFVLILSTCAVADVVVPVESVESHVNIRMLADSKSEIVGRLNQGDHLPLVASTAEWHEVEIAGGATGYISADWAMVLDEPPAIADDVEMQTEADAPDETLAEIVASDGVSSAGEILVDEIETIGATVADDLQDMVSEQADTDDILPAAVADEAAAEPMSAEVAASEDALAEEDIAAGDPLDINDTLAESSDASPVLTEAAKAAEVVAATEETIVTAVQESDRTIADSEADKAAIPVVDSSAGNADAAEPVTELPAPVALETETEPALPGVQGLAGPQGPPGIPGPPGPAGAASIEGSVGFLTRFTAPTIGGTSQVYDDGNNIGIGTTEPKQRLEVNGNIQIHERNSSVAGLMITQSDGDTGYIMHNRAGTLTIGAGSVDRITIDRDGNVGMGISRPKNPIELASGAHVTAGGVWTNSSSRARKENIAELSLDDALSALTRLEPVRFNYINDQAESYVGFIAEDVPELVATSDRDGLSSMDIVAVLTRVVQEQQKKIEALEARLDQR